MSATKRKLPEPQPFFSPTRRAYYLTEQERQALQQLWQESESTPVDHTKSQLH